MHEMLDQLVQPSILGVCGFIVWFLKSLATSVKTLNEAMAVYVEKVTKIVEHLEDHEDRIRRLERDNIALN